MIEQLKKCFQKYYPGIPFNEQYARELANMTEEQRRAEYARLEISYLGLLDREIT